MLRRLFHLVPWAGDFILVNDEPEIVEVVSAYAIRAGNLVINRNSCVWDAQRRGWIYTTQRI